VLPVRISIRAGFAFARTPRNYAWITQGSGSTFVLGGMLCKKIASITGHATLEEVSRYTKATEQKKLPQAAVNRLTHSESAGFYTLKASREVRKRHAKPTPTGPHRFCLPKTGNFDVLVSSSIAPPRRAVSTAPIYSICSPSDGR
jgi:hypothetical protein